MLFKQPVIHLLRRKVAMEPNIQKRLPREVHAVLHKEVEEDLLINRGVPTWITN